MVWLPPFPGARGHRTVEACRRRRCASAGGWAGTGPGSGSLGVVVGRRVVSLLTTALGIVPGAEQPAGLLLLGVAGAVLIANGLALLPARRAARVGIAQLSLDR
jgi:hypothetical protein